MDESIITNIMEELIITYESIIVSSEESAVLQSS